MGNPRGNSKGANQAVSKAWRTTPLQVSQHHTDIRTTTNAPSSLSHQSHHQADTQTQTHIRTQAHLSRVADVVQSVCDLWRRESTVAHAWRRWAGGGRGLEQVAGADGSVVHHEAAALEIWAGKQQASIGRHAHKHRHRHRHRQTLRQIVSRQIALWSHFCWSS